MDSSSLVKKAPVVQEIDTSTLTRLQRKRMRMLGEANSMKRSFFSGFLVGGAVGGIFGGLTGCYFAYAHKQISMIPLMALTSGCTFGFFMGIGGVIRSAPEMAPIDT